MTFLSGPITNTLRTVWLSAGVRSRGSPETSAGQHAVELRDLEVGVADDRVVGRGALRLLDVLRPPLVVARRVDGEADDLHAALVELGLGVGHVAELGRADRREVLRVREEHRPESPIQSWKLIRPSVVSASKSGAVSPIVSAMCFLLVRYDYSEGTSLQERLHRRSPQTVATIARAPPRSRCPHRYRPCHVPSASRPSVTGRVIFGPGQRRLDVRRHVVRALECVGPRRSAQGRRCRTTWRKSRRTSGEAFSFSVSDALCVLEAAGGRGPTRSSPSSGRASTISRVTRWKPRGRGCRAISRWVHIAAPSCQLARPTRRGSPVSRLPPGLRAALPCRSPWVSDPSARTIRCQGHGRGQCRQHSTVPAKRGAAGSRSE